MGPAMLRTNGTHCLRFESAGTWTQNFDGRATRFNALPSIYCRKSIKPFQNLKTVENV